MLLRVKLVGGYNASSVVAIIHNGVSIGMEGTWGLPSAGWTRADLVKNEINIIENRVILRSYLNPYASIGFSVVLFSECGSEAKVTLSTPLCKTTKKIKKKKQLENPYNEHFGKIAQNHPNYLLPNITYSLRD